jgi:hypothetical protein
MQTHTVYPDGTTSATSTCGASVVCLVLVEKIRAAGESTPKVYSRTRSCVQTCPHERSFMLLPRLTRERLASGVNGAPNCSFSLCPSYYRMEESTAHPTFSGISQLYSFLLGTAKPAPCQVLSFFSTIVQPQRKLENYQQCIKRHCPDLCTSRHVGTTIMSTRRVLRNGKSLKLITSPIMRTYDASHV